ncbi:hypothetical protein E1A91_D08G201700v1 [Gossypium mustelinum]|uniref:Uncharacterized protein n=1 Tax=Gossypium mustelinum TaxID=34275 RepID=A0A5D2TZ53_GOSMU|nr:hypothetical protein E1A91_D08G201700v1 [Gossypium mustelinum]
MSSPGGRTHESLIGALISLFFSCTYLFLSVRRTQRDTQIIRLWGFEQSSKAQASHSNQSGIDFEVTIVSSLIAILLLKQDNEEKHVSCFLLLPHILGSLCLLLIS